MFQHFGTVGILPEVLVEFEAIFRKRNPNAPALKDIEKTLRKTLKNVRPLDVEGDNKLYYVSPCDIIFVIDKGTSVLVSVSKHIPSHKDCPLPMHKVHFTTHSIQRFLERYGYTGDEPELFMRRIFSQSKEQEIEPARKVLRIINNGFKNGRYFRHGRWRFVVVENDEVYNVVTFENIESKTLKWSD